jgi:hypothetical protein
MAVAAYLGLKDHVYAETNARRGSYDLPPDIDVKTSARHSHNLLCLLDERPGKRLVLVTIENKQILLRGWITTTDAMQPRWREERVPGRPCYFVPPSQLHDMSDLLATSAAYSAPSETRDAVL